jgi:hypothetical protein
LKEPIFAITRAAFPTSFVAMSPHVICHEKGDFTKGMTAANSCRIMMATSHLVIVVDEIVAIGDDFMAI